MIVVTALWIGLRNKTRSYLRNCLKIVLRPSVNQAPGVTYHNAAETYKTNNHTLNNTSITCTHKCIILMHKL